MSTTDTQPIAPGQTWVHNAYRVEVTVTHQRTPGMWEATDELGNRLIVAESTFRRSYTRKPT